MLVRRKMALLMVTCLTFSLVGCGSDKKEVKEIGISQIIQHPALDKATEGFIEGLKEKGYVDGENIKLEIKNANGEVSTSQTIAKQFVNDSKDLIFTVGTPAAQVAHSSTKEIPVVFTAVTDPVDAGLVSSLDKTGNNLTGTTDIVPMDKQMDLLTSLVKDIKTLGVVYNTSEDNSIQQVKQLEKACEKLNIKVKKIGVTNVGEVTQNLEISVNDIDALYTPTDNTIAAAYDLVCAVAKKKGIPVFGAEDSVVEKGGLCSLSIDYTQLGKEAAYKAVSILEGKKPEEIKVEGQKELKVVINEDVAKQLGIKIPDDLKSSAVLKHTGA